MIKILRQAYADHFEKSLLEEIEEVGVLKEVPAGTMLMDIGQYVTSIPLLLDGAIKIMRLDDDGDELLLYFLEKGDTCAMTMSCCLGQTISEIRAVTELDTILMMIPVQKMEEWTAKYKTWRNFVFESYHERLMEMLEAIDTVAFMNMDQRLLKYLQDKASVTHENIIHNTHQQIAHELHTSRVVVSRLLKKLELEGQIALGRNHIELINLQSQV